MVAPNKLKALVKESSKAKKPPFGKKPDDDEDEKDEGEDAEKGAVPAEEVDDATGSDPIDAGDGDAPDYASMTAEELADEIEDALDVITEAAKRLAAGDNPDQPEKGLQAMSEALSPQASAGLAEWAKGKKWEDFIALAEKIGADDPDKFAGWLKAVKERG
jgi:hypothetical protein